MESIITSFNHSDEMNQMINATKTTTSKYFSSSIIKHYDNPKSFTFRLCVLNQKQNIESLKGFFIFVVISEDSIRFKVFFTIRNEPYKFSNISLMEKALRLISLINLELDLGFFNINEKFNTLQLELAICYKKLNIVEAQNLICPYIKKAAYIYNDHVQQFYVLIEESKKVPKNCIKANIYQTNLGNEEKKINSCDTSGDETEEEVSSHNMIKEESKIEDTDNDEELSDSCTTEYENNSHNTSEDYDILNFIDENPNLKAFFKNSINEMQIAHRPEFFCMHLYKFLEIEDLPGCLLDEILLTLIKMYQYRLEFFKFPTQNIIIFGTKAEGFNFFLVSDDIDKVAKIRDIDEIEILKPSDYKNDLFSYYLEFQSNILDNFMHPNYELSNFDKISSENFKYPSLTEDEMHIGKGGFGEVYKNELHGTEVAIKFAKEDQKNDAKAQLRFQKELNIMKSLCHENITKCYGYVFYNNKYGLVIEYCSKGTLSEYLKNTPEKDLPKRLKFLLGIAYGLEFMHSKNICHFDIKPQNIFFDDNYIPKIGDFGMSEHMREGFPVKPGFTINYCAPEHIKGENPNQSADIWSFGMTSYSLIVQRRPFDYLKKANKSDTEPEEFCKIIEKENKRPELTESFKKHLPQIVNLFEATWELNPESRPPAKDIRALLNQWLIRINRKVVNAS